MGASFVSDTVVKSLPSDESVVFYKVDDPETVREVYLYYRKNKYLTRSMSEFIKRAIPESEEEKERE